MMRPPPLPSKKGIRPQSPVLPLRAPPSLVFCFSSRLVFLLFVLIFSAEVLYSMPPVYSETEPYAFAFFFLTDASAWSPVSLLPTLPSYVSPLFFFFPSRLSFFSGVQVGRPRHHFTSLAAIFTLRLQALPLPVISVSSAIIQIVPSCLDFFFGDRSRRRYPPLPSPPAPSKFVQSLLPKSRPIRGLSFFSSF